jgi:crossover junction endodeoxyribonuclease RusA
MTSYRPADVRQTTPFAGDSQPLDRAAILAQLKSSRRTSLFQGPVPLPTTITPESLLITLPIPPSINHQYATVNGRRLLSSSGRAYKTHVSQQVWVALAQSPCRSDLLRSLQSSRLALSIRFFFTSALRRDVDGGLKIAQDALCEGLGLNDNRIIETHLYKDLDKVNPRIEVSLSAAR